MHKTLHWTQRIALVRYNLHSASRSGDFTFFKTLQAQGLVEGTNHVATLSDTLGDEADIVLSGLDDLNSNIAHVHQDAFKSVYDGLKTFIAQNEEFDMVAGRSKVYVDSTIQKQMADNAIDKTISSAIALISQQPPDAQDTAASVFITGATIIADCVEVCHKQMAILEIDLDDFIRLEDAWSTVRTAVTCAIAALKGIFSLMDVEEHPKDCSSRHASFSFGANNVFRRLSNAFSSNPSTISAPESTRSASVVIFNASSRRNSIHAPEYRTPDYTHSPFSTSCPAPSLLNPFPHTTLSPIPPTPLDLDQEINPLDDVPLTPSLAELRLSDYYHHSQPVMVST
ncbi:hypothetical protein MBLNU459_g2070t1 [Dothideomycetes sp. NU459]